MSQEKCVTAIVGQPLQIVLQSNVGSTGYGWYLSFLDGGIALFGSCVTPASSAYGGPSNHAFDFVALKEGTYKVEFILIAPWRMEEPAQTETYTIEIKAPSKTAADDIEEAMKSQRFTSADAVSPESGPSMVLKYATPMASPVLKYAAPMGGMDASATMLAYAAPMASAGQATCASCGPVILYAAPMAQANMATVTNLYAAPMAQANAMTQPMPMYAAPLGACTTDPCTAAASVNMLYQAPMMQANAMAQPVYAAPMTQPMPMYAAPVGACATDPCTAAASVSMLYQAPMMQANAMAQPVYAAPMPQPMPMYAAPATCQPADPRMGLPPFTILYAAPMIRGGASAQPLYAAPSYTPVQALYAAPMAQASFAMPPYAAPCNPATGCCC
ncbi:protease inhibitor I42 family protein [Desulfoluna butyratoxydans]|uniref:Proteinase inhibitor i42 chagasin n=1 Tax=Desulfoluna butyratoxydans TaxID=231438 RepID=A0A4V6YUE8_9BACT|nr:protease inhibitor I42 family protein [Desulfoluna butyratoxydans]VFQ45928.1 proteinase inhibitor i42 chagasin [Desulfoluna butyratoxydans]